MNKLGKLGTANIICGISYILSVCILWILTHCGGITVSEVEGAESLVLIFSVIIFFFETAVTAVAGVYCVSTGVAYRKRAGSGKKAWTLLVTSAVLKSFFAAATVIGSVLLMNMFMPIPGAVGVAVAAALCVDVVLDIAEAVREKKEKAE